MSYSFSSVERWNTESPTSWLHHVYLRGEGREGRGKGRERREKREGRAGKGRGDRNTEERSKVDLRGNYILCNGRGRVKLPVNTLKTKQTFHLY